MAVKVKHQEWNGDMQHTVHYVLTVEKALEITSRQTSKDMAPRIPPSHITDRNFEENINIEDVPF